MNVGRAHIAQPRYLTCRRHGSRRGAAHLESRSASGRGNVAGGTASRSAIRYEMGGLAGRSSAGPWGTRRDRALLRWQRYSSHRRAGTTTSERRERSSQQDGEGVICRQLA
jgi:hypothetical protein